MLERQLVLFLVVAILVDLNVDDAPEISARLGVQGIPTMLLFSGGAEIARQVGALPGPALDQWLEQSLTDSR